MRPRAVLLDLMRRGWATAFVMNGAASIHDFEIAMAGHTSEDVEAVLPDGRFGAAEETGREMNSPSAAGAGAVGHGGGARSATRDAGQTRVRAAEPAARRLSGSGSGHGSRGDRHGHAAYASAADGAAIGAATHRDFRLLCSLVTDLDGGGVYLNLGSAVVLPEVFLKAVSVVRTSVIR